MKFDCIVIGGGAAGLMCAATAGYRGRSVLVLDHANKVGKKILMSGGGRCNFTNYSVEPANYLSANPHFCKSALSRYRPQDFIELVERHGVAYHEKTKGQLFCDNKSMDILQLLITECDYAGVEVQTHCEVTRVMQLPSGFTLATSRGEYQCESLVIATGGLSIPTMGATGFGYEVAGQFGIECLPRWASLVPFTITDKWQPLVSDLSGVSLDVITRVGKQQFYEALLFTHRGLSGPAILQISNYWRPGQTLCVNFCPQQDVQQALTALRQRGSKQEVKTILSQWMPKRFVSVWLEHSGFDTPLAQASDAQLSELGRLFNRWEIIPSGTEGYRTAEVTMGGVNTDEVSSKTFELSLIHI